MLGARAAVGAVAVAAAAAVALGVRGRDHRVNAHGVAAWRFRRRDRRGLRFSRNHQV